MSQPAFSTAYNRDRISYDLAVKILTAYPDISAEWLLRSIGPMLRGGEVSQVISGDNTSGSNINNSTITPSADAGELERLRAENARMRDEIDWLRGMVGKRG